MRLYSFVAGGYLSDLQKGLQTAHGVARLFTLFNKNRDIPQQQKQIECLNDWANHHETIIILNAFNHQKVRDIYHTLKPLADELHLPSAIFYEDEESMNGMATCTCVVVPEHYYNVIPFVKSVGFIEGFRKNKNFARYYEYVDSNGITTEYEEGTTEYKFIDVIKSRTLA